MKKKIESFLKKHDKLRLFLRKLDYRARQIWYGRIAKKHNIEPNLILFESFMGRQYACNPRGIYEDILVDERFKDFTFVWAFKDAEKRDSDFERTIYIEYKSKEYYEYCARAKYIITNSSLDFAFKPKEEQVVLQTWHGTPLKRLRCDIEAEFGNANNSLEEICWKNDVDVVRYDYFLSPSRFASDKFTTAFRLEELSKQEILVETGYPRNDFLSNYTEDDVKRVKEKIGIDHVDKKVILYAPTFRENQHQAGVGYTYKTEVDFQRLQDELADEYIILFRPHYFVANQFDFEKYKGFIYNVTDIDDVKELYIITDLLLTDYSSVFFDYAVLKRPILFYMYDLEEYAEDIRGFYMSLDQLPGPIVETEDELIKKIKEETFEYDDKYRVFNNTFNYLEDGKAGKRLIEQVFFEEKSDKKPDIVVLSRNYSTGLGIIRALGEAGYNIDLIASTKKKGSSIIASCSKYVRSSVEVLSTKIQGDTGENLIQALLEYAGKNKGEKKILFPADDFTTSVMDKNRDVLEEHFLMPRVLSEGNESLVQIMDKNFQSKVAEQVGFLTPAEWIISIKDRIDIPSDVVYPCFVKPLHSFDGHKTEMAVCANQDELYAHLTKMQEFYSDRSVLVQEYLQIDKEIDLSGVCIDQEIVIPSIIEKTRIAKHEQGVTMSGVMKPIETLGSASEKIVELLKQFHYIGMFDMEWNICNGKIYFNEVNFRSGGPNFAYFLNGINLPEIFVKAISKQELHPKDVKLKTYGKSFVYEKVAWEDYIYGYMSKAEMKKCINQADFKLLDYAKDPKPGKCFQRRIHLSALKNRLKNKPAKNNKKPNGPKVVIAGRNYGNILAMTRGMGQAGYAVDVLRVYKKKTHSLNILGKMKPDKHSCYVGNFYECIVNDNPSRMIDQLLEIASTQEKALLIPVDDYTVCIIDEHLERLKNQYWVPSIHEEPGAISELMNKQKQKELAKDFNLPLLKSWLIQSTDRQYQIPKDISYPCFIKPNVSMKSTKAKMAKCENEEELKKILDQYAQKEDFDILVEEFADIKTEYSILGISTPEGSVAPCMFQVTSGGHRERKGVAITGRTIETYQYEKIIESCIDFIHSLGYVGLFDIDLIETKSGKVYFIEINFRAGASVHVFTESGVNLPGMMGDYFTKNIIPDRQNINIATGKNFLSEKVLLEEYVRSDASLQEVRKTDANADVYFIKDEADPKPYKNFKKFYIIASMMRIPYRLKDRKRERKNNV